MLIRLNDLDGEIFDALAILDRFDILGLLIFGIVGRFDDIVFLHYRIIKIIIIEKMIAEFFLTKNN